MTQWKETEYNTLLKPGVMIMLYARGAFPMANQNGIIEWYLPETRTIIPLSNYNYPRSLRKFIEHSGLEFKYDFETMEIVKNCANRDETWISDELIKAYEGLLNLGYLHSVGVYLENKLVGGLYGVTFKGAFFGESMFSKISQASKSALIKLIERLNACNFVLLDVQFQTDHLKMFGAVEISFEKYQELLLKAYSIDTQFKICIF